jgi:hypothetical protein
MLNDELADRSRLSRWPSVRTLTVRVAELRPDLPGLGDYTHRTVVFPS